MLADTRFKKNDYKNILKNLKNINAKKYEPTKLYLGKVLAKGKKISSNKLLPNYFIKNKSVLIFGPAKSVRKNRSKIEKFIRKQKLFVIGVNSSSGISENLVDQELFAIQEDLYLTLIFKKLKHRL